MYYTHILLAVDGSEASRKAELECFAFARSGGAKVTAIHVLPTLRPHDEEAREAAREKMSELEMRAGAGGARDPQCGQQQHDGQSRAGHHVLQWHGGPEGQHSACAADRRMTARFV